jgi:hypothetical protein
MDIHFLPRIIVRLDFHRVIALDVASSELLAVTDERRIIKIEFGWFHRT